MRIVELKKSKIILPNEIISYNLNQKLEKQSVWALKVENSVIDSKNVKDISRNLVPNSAIDKNLKAKITFQQALKLPLLFGQVMCMIPVLGILQPDFRKIRYTRASLVYVVSLILLSIQLIVTILCTVRLFRVPISFGLVSYVLFYGVVTLTSIVFLRIAKIWPDLMKEIFRSEAANPNYDEYLKIKCSAATVTILSFALIEHFLSIISHLSTIADCIVDGYEVYRIFIERSYPWLYEVVSIETVFLKIFLQIVNIICTLNWNYSDLFIICMSLYLISRLEQMNKRLASARGKYLPPIAWKKLREDYNDVTRLIRDFDEVINGVVFVSFASNLFFICLQMYNTLSKRLNMNTGFCTTKVRVSILQGQEHTVYYIFSAMFLLARSLTVSLVAAGVHSSSLLAAPALYDVPSPVYCVEVQRFLEQLHGDTVALTGLKFFRVTRGLVLSVAGTIVTYELVLLQFNGDDDIVQSRVNSTSGHL